MKRSEGRVKKKRIQFVCLSGVEDDNSRNGDKAGLCRVTGDSIKIQLILMMVSRSAER